MSIELLSVDGGSTCSKDSKYSKRQPRKLPPITSSASSGESRGRKQSLKSSSTIEVEFDWGGGRKRNNNRKK